LPHLLHAPHHAPLPHLNQQRKGMAAARKAKQAATAPRCLRCLRCLLLLPTMRPPPTFHIRWRTRLGAPLPKPDPPWRGNAGGERTRRRARYSEYCCSSMRKVNLSRRFSKGLHPSARVCSLALRFALCAWLLAPSILFACAPVCVCVCVCRPASLLISLALAPPLSPALSCLCPLFFPPSPLPPLSCASSRPRGGWDVSKPVTNACDVGVVLAQSVRRASGLARLGGRRHATCITRTTRTTRARLATPHMPALTCVVRLLHVGGLVRVMHVCRLLPQVPPGNHRLCLCPRGP
jgi:hypothetical protein